MAQSFLQDPLLGIFDCDHEISRAGLPSAEIVHPKDTVGHGIALGYQKATCEFDDVAMGANYARNILDNHGLRL